MTTFIRPIRAMPHQRRNHDRLARRHADALAVQLHLRSLAALDNIVNLGQPPVVVSAGIDRDLGLVQREGKPRHVSHARRAVPQGHATGSSLAKSMICQRCSVAGVLMVR